jgi:hypothetical protein
MRRHGIPETKKQLFQYLFLKLSKKICKKFVYPLYLWAIIRINGLSALCYFDVWSTLSLLKKNEVEWHIVNTYVDDVDSDF